MNHYEVSITRAAIRDMESSKIPRRVVDAVIEFLDGPLAEAPHRVGKPLREPLEGLWSGRRGTYRIIYAIDDATYEVHVVAVKYRGDAYRSR